MYEGVNMKKLLILTLAMILIVGASVQARDTLFVRIGTADLSDLAVGVDKWLDLAVFMTAHTTDVQGADLNAPVGINNCYVDLFGADTECFALFPLSGWDVGFFGNFNEDYTTDGNGCTWDSYSFTGFQDPNPPYNAPALEFTPETWIQTLSYKIHTINRPELLDSTICDAVGAGSDPVSGPWNCGDPLGGAGYEVIVEAACFWFSPNQPPVIEEFSTNDLCTYEDASIAFDVTDPDSDPLDVTSTLGSVVLVGSDVDGDATIYHYTLNFTADEFCGQCLNGEVVITATDNNNDPVTWAAGNVTFIGKITASMNDSLPIWPGMTDWMPVYLDACGDCFCLGGFVFTIEYDASVLSVTEVVRGAAIAGGEYWNVNYNIDGPGTIRVTFINDLNNQTPVEDICAIDPEVPLFEMAFELAAGPDYPSNFCIPICFMFDGVGEDHFDYNNVSDAGGYNVWINDGCDVPPDSSEYGTLLLEMECGNIKVLNQHNVFLGDLNGNRMAYEVGDVVLLANHLIDPIAFPFDMRQMFASDVNGDGYQASIADLIMMINIVNGTIEPGGKVAPINVIATVAMPVDAYGDVDVTISSELSVGGALVSINHTGVELGVPTANGMNMEYRDNGEVMTVLVYQDVNSFAPGSNVLFSLPVLSEGTISFGEVSISDNRGALLDARTALDAPIPTEFSVAQNFPNPFNAKTSLSFGIPAAGVVNINIYNVAGQLVESMDLGQMNAGFHSVVWDASDVASGIYFYKVSAGNNNETMKMTLLK
jgi:hypothetical protein